MTLSDTHYYSQVIGCLMHKPLLLIEYPDMQPNDFDIKSIRVCFRAIQKLYEAGVLALTPLEIDQEIEHCGGAAASVYKAENGLSFLKEAYKYAKIENFNTYYERIKKYSLLQMIILKNYI